MIVSVPERGSSRLAPEVWAQLSASSAFWALVQQEIVRPVATSKGAWSLHAGSFVGRALIGEIVLEVSEKIPGALAGLLSVLTPNSFKSANAGSPLTKTDQPAPLLARAFLLAARTYLSGLKLVSYRRENSVGSLVSGRLEPVKTARLRASGVRHKVSFSRWALSDDLPLNRVLYAALGEVARGGRQLGLSVPEIATARALRLAFDDDSVRPHLGERVSDLAELAWAEAKVPGRRREVTEVAELAAAILSSLDLAWTGAWDFSGPRAWFLNLENLFERAVRTCVAECLSGQADVSGPSERPPLFALHPQRYRANPDVVITPKAGSLVIGDAKYKDLELWPKAADVHELLAHAAAYGAVAGVLFYPSPGDVTVRNLGPSAGGCRVIVAGVPVVGMQTGVQSAFNAIGGLPAISNAAAVPLALQNAVMATGAAGL